MGVDINNDPGHEYGPETIVSEHTNRPIDEDNIETSPVFWCEICQVKLRTAHTAIQHVGGKPHRGRVVAMGNPNIQNTKRKSEADSGKAQVLDPANKKAKPATEPSLECEDCNLTFNSALMAIQHFKGKKHATAVAAKLEAKKTQVNRWPSPGRGAGNSRGRGRGTGGVGVGGRGGGGRGRGDGSRGRGLINRAGGLGRGSAAGQLVRALKNFYDQTPNNPLTDPGYNSWSNTSNSTAYDPKVDYNYSSNNRFASTPSYLSKDRLGSKDYYSSSARPQQYTQGTQRDIYDNDYSGTSNYSTTTPSTSSNNRFTAGGSTTTNNRFAGNNSGGDYYSRDYWHK